MDSLGARASRPPSRAALLAHDPVYDGYDGDGEADGHDYPSYYAGFGFGDLLGQVGAELGYVGFGRQVGQDGFDAADALFGGLSFFG